MSDLDEIRIPRIEDIPPLNQHQIDPKELVRAAIYQFGGRFIGTIYDNAIGDGDHNPEKVLHALQFKWLIEQIPQIQNKLNRLLQIIPPEDHPEPSDISAIFEAAYRVSRKTADPKKRKLLKAALINAFDKELYLEGMTLRLMGILEDLYYGDIDILNRLNIEVQGNSSLKKYSQNRLTDQELHHIEILEKYALVRVATNSTPQQITIRTLGQKLLQLVLKDYPDDDV